VSGEHSSVIIHSSGCTVRAVNHSLQCMRKTLPSRGVDVACNAVNLQTVTGMLQDSGGAMQEASEAAHPRAMFCECGAPVSISAASHGMLMRFLCQPDQRAARRLLKACWRRRSPRTSARTSCAWQASAGGRRTGRGPWN